MRRRKRTEPAKILLTIFLQRFNTILTSPTDNDPGRDEKGTPVLFHKYLELGGRLLAFNLDPHFNNTPDGLIFANLPQPSRRLLEFYMGRDCAAGYLRYHLEVDRLRRNTTGLGHGLRKGGAPEKGANEWRPAVSTS